MSINGKLQVSKAPDYDAEPALSGESPPERTFVSGGDFPRVGALWYHYELSTERVNFYAATPGSYSGTDSFGHLRFQNGPIPERGVNGITNELLIELLIDRTHVLDEKLPCQENAVAIDHLTMALNAFHDRTARRLREGTEGEYIER